MYLLAKYNTQTDFYFPMVKRAVVDLAVTGDWTPATGDTKISKDGGAVANTTNNPAIASGVSWKLTLTATELSAKWITVQIVDSATKAVEDQFLTILTYGNASAFFPAPDYQDAVHFGLTALPNAAAEAAGGLYTRGTGAGQINQPANGQIDANTVKLSGTAQTARDIGASVLVGDKTGFSLSAAGIQAIWDALTSALTTVGSIGKLLVDNINVALSTLMPTSHINATAGKVDGVALVDTTTTNTDMRGTDNAATAAALATAQADLDTLTGADGANVATADRPGVRKNTALAAFEFLMTDSTNHAPATGLTVSVTRSIDGGAFAAGGLSVVTEVSNGIYKVDFAASDLNGDVVTLRATATGADDLFVTFRTSP